MLNLCQIGSYHYVSGVDASSSASLAAYLNSLTYAIEDSGAWFSKGSIWKVRSGCYWHVSCILNIELNHADHILVPVVASTPSLGWMFGWMSRYPVASTHTI